MYLFRDSLKKSIQRRKFKYQCPYETNESFCIISNEKGVKLK